MARHVDALCRAKKALGLKSGAVTASGSSAAIDLADLADGTLIATLNAAAATAGTNPTLDVKITHCDTSGGTYTDAGIAFTQVTTSDSHQHKLFKKEDVKQFIKFDWTIGGTSSPSFPAAMELIGLERDLVN
jgi:hypothetical protein